MKLTKEIKDKIDTYFADKTPEELEYIFEKYKPKKKKKVVEEVLDRDWAQYKFERPVKENFYVTKVRYKGKIEEVADWWNGHCFMYNNDLITHWKRK